MRKLKKYGYWGAIALYCFTPCSMVANERHTASSKASVEWVNPLIGTTGIHRTEYGGRFPAVMRPFGMIQWTAMTRENRISACPYHYDDKTIIGFTGTHQPSIWMGDYGYVSFMPQTGELKLDASERGMSYSHQNEISKPYYYSVKMGEGDQRIKAEQTATTRCGFYKIDYPQNRAAHLSVEMSRLLGYEGYVKIIPEKRMIVGYNADHQNTIGGKNMGPTLKKFRGYFVMQFDCDFSDFGTYFYPDSAQCTAQTVVRQPGNKDFRGDRMGAYVTFAPTAGGEVKVKIGSSYISLAQAEENLRKEIRKWNFEKTVSQCKEEWQHRLDRIEVEGGSADERTLFYTFLCNSMMYPSLFSEYGSYYSPFDEQIHEGVSYNAYSLWDTFRALHPLLLFVAHDHVSPMITSLLQMYDEGGWIPKWPNPTYSNIMIGTHSDAVIADAFVKGVRNFDLDKAYAAIYKNAMTAPEGDATFNWPDRHQWRAYEGRGGLTWYKRYGYVPTDKTKESVSRTLEFAYDDYCVAQVARGLGKTADYEYFLQRSKNYRHLYNPESGFMHARLSNGKFAQRITGDRAFTEGSPWTYLFCAMQDVPGLVELMGGREAFIAKLDQNFREGHYRHDNEPGHHYVYLYDYVGQPWKTQELVAEVLRTKYANAPGGLSGNDDCGQMSAWYIFSAMGFYPVCPGSDVYALGKPLFDKVTIRLEGGHRFTIKANHLSKENCYVKQIRLDGAIVPEPFLRHSDILRHQLLEFDMTSECPDR